MRNNTSEWLLRCLWILALAAVLYSLGFGPVCAWAQRYAGRKQQVTNFYQPIIWLHNHTPLESLIEAYSKLWGVD